MNRVAEVNRELRKRGHAERLKRGKDYYFFYDGGTSRWPVSGVYVYRAAELSLEEWMRQYEQLKADAW